jgi:ABC-2 type transport system ATP-binding protein
MHTQYAIETEGLEKSYGNVRVLDGVDLRVERGSVFALLGPNGAGKTTTVRILATLTRPDAGIARVDGLDVVADVHAVRPRISLSGQYAALDELQNGRENLRMLGRLAGLSRRGASARAEELLERFGIADAGTRRVANYSGGMRRRLDLAASLVSEPTVIFLDEPTTGLDPRSRQAMWDVVTELAGSGVTVFLTTQYLEEADRLAALVAVLDHGRVVAQGAPSELKRRVGEQRLDLVLTHARAFDAAASLLDGRVLTREPEQLLLGLATDGSAPHVRALLDEVDPGGCAIERFSLHSATLDDVFLSLTGEDAVHD